MFVVVVVAVVVVVVVVVVAVYVATHANTLRSSQNWVFHIMLFGVTLQCNFVVMIMNISGL